MSANEFAVEARKAQEQLQAIGRIIDDAGYWKKEESPYSIGDKSIAYDISIRSQVLINCLAAADGEISQDEVDLYNKVIAPDYGLQTWFQGVDEYKSKIETRKREGALTHSSYNFPKYIECCVTMDKEKGTLHSREIVRLLREMGMAVINMGGTPTKCETDELTGFLTEIETYLDKQGIPKEKSAEENLDDLIKELNGLVGLKKVKQDVNSLINFIKIRKIRKERGIDVAPMSLHLVFSGNPGTGKTTVARLLARIYHALGLLSKGHLVEVDRSGLVAGYVGQTAIKTKGVIDSARGGVLFIDEAYALSSSKADNDYGKEAIETLLKAMEDYRDDFIVIVAGYTDLMETFLDSNPGLRSRFNKFIEFEDYTPEELLEILKSFCAKSKYTLTGGAESCAAYFFAARCSSKLKNFANARDVRNYFEKAVASQANRLAALTDISDDALKTIEAGDMKDIVL